MYENDSLASKKTLIEIFGTDIGTKLFGSAVKIANRYGISVDDAAQELAMGGLTVKEKYGFVHVNTVYYRAVDAITKTAAYSDFPRRKPIYDSLDNEDSYTPETAMGAIGMASEGFNWSRVDTALCVESAMDGITDETDLAIARGYMDGYGPTEIGESLGVHHSTVVKRKKRHLTKIFRDSV